MDLNEVLESERPSWFLYHYARNHGRLSPKWERLFLEFKDMFYITIYTQDIIKNRWPEAEHALLESKNAFEMMWYAKYIIKERWPKAEPLIRQSKWWIKYCEFFNIKE